MLVAFFFFLGISMVMTNNDADISLEGLYKMTMIISSCTVNVLRNDKKKNRQRNKTALPQKQIEPPSRVTLGVSSAVPVPTSVKSC